MISFWSLQTGLSFDLNSFEINFDQARSATQLVSVKSLLGALGAICNIASNDEEDFFAVKLFVYYEWKGRYKLEEQENEKQ